MSALAIHRLEGLESDNLLAFLALLGTLRALEAASPELKPRASWSIDVPPLRPQLHLAQATSTTALATVIAAGVTLLARTHEFEGRANLNFAPEECRAMLKAAAADARPGDRARADLLTALMHDAAVKNNKDPTIDPTPLCLLFGQGHQHFLQRLADVPRQAAPPPRGQGKQAQVVTAEQAIREALFDTWHRQDPTPSFRWDPAEDVRYATMGGDPTDAAFKGGTQHGANRLAAVALPLLQLGAQSRHDRVRPVVSAGLRDREGFSMAWPVWRLPLTLAAVRALLMHPRLRFPGDLDYLGVVDVLQARRISVGKFMNFGRARPLR